MSKKQSGRSGEKRGGWYYRLELSKKTSLWGVIFLTPWILGFLVFFLKPLIESVMYSFNKVDIVPGAGVSMNFIGWENYIQSFTVDTVFNRLMLTMITSTLPQVLIVVVFSLLVAIMLNGKYFGRSAARTIFFIPIIMGTAIASAKLTGGDAVTLELSGALEEPTAFGASFMIDLLMYSGLPTELIGYVTGAVSSIFAILSISGVPILIFLAGLQSISPSLYEVAKIEGSTAYETFWKVTFPMISPMVLLCTVYSIIDGFARHTTAIDGRKYGITQGAGIIGWFYNTAFTQANQGMAAAMTTVYLLVTMAVLGIVAFLISRVVFYYD